MQSLIIQYTNLVMIMIMKHFYYLKTACLYYKAVRKNYLITSCCHFESGVNYRFIEPYSEI